MNHLTNSRSGADVSRKCSMSSSSRKPVWALSEIAAFPAAQYIIYHLDTKTLQIYKLYLYCDHFLFSDWRCNWASHPPNRLTKKDYTVSPALRQVRLVQADRLRLLVASPSTTCQPLCTPEPVLGPRVDTKLRTINICSNFSFQLKWETSLKACLTSWQCEDFLNLQNEERGLFPPISSGVASAL